MGKIKVFINKLFEKKEKHVCEFDYGKTIDYRGMLFYKCKFCNMCTLTDEKGEYVSPGFKKLFFTSKNYTHNLQQID